MEERAPLLSVGHARQSSNDGGSSPLRPKLPPDQRITGSSVASIVARASAHSSQKQYFVATRSINRSHGVVFTFEDVSIVHKAFFESCYRKPEVVVQQACGVFPAGQLHAISGVNIFGCNKMLRALSGNETPTEGSILANNVPVQSSTFRSVVGYVGAHIPFINAFTTHTNVKFALEMRSRSRGDGAATAVEEALEVMNLDPSKFCMQLDPSERLRLQIAMELVTDPPVLLLENPLTGLDVHDAADICEHLRRVARELHKTVVITAAMLPHPLFERLDSILLLGNGGHTIFSGLCGHMCNYISGLRLPTQLLNSPTRRESRARLTLRRRQSTFLGTENELLTDDGDDTDVIVVDTGGGCLDVLRAWAAHDRRYQRQQGNQPHTMQFAAKFYDSEYRAQLLEQIREAENVASRGDNTSGSYGASPNSLLSNPFNVTMHHEHPSMFVKTALLIRYKLEQGLRQKDFYISFILLVICLGFAVWLMSNQKLDQQGMQNIRGIMFFLFSVLLELNIVGLPSLMDDKMVFTQQRDGDYYNALCAVVTFVVRLAITRAVYLATAAVFVAVVLTGMNELILLLGVTSFTHACLLWVVALLSSNRSVATFIAYVLEAYMIVFSGFLINLSSLPIVVAKTSLLRYGYGAAVAQQLRGVPFSCDASYAVYNGTKPPDLPNVTSYCYTGDQYLALEGFDDDTTVTNVGQMMGIATALLVIAGVRLHYMNR